MRMFKAIFFFVFNYKCFIIFLIPPIKYKPSAFQLTNKVVYNKTQTVFLKQNNNNKNLPLDNNPIK